MEAIPHRMEAGDGGGGISVVHGHNHHVGGGGGSDNGGSPGRQSHVRRESWYVDMLGHGLSDRDIATLMGDMGLDDDEDDDNDDPEGFLLRQQQQQQLTSSGDDNNDNNSYNNDRRDDEPDSTTAPASLSTMGDTVLEQECIMAIAEAKRRLTQLGFYQNNGDNNSNNPASSTHDSWQETLQPLPQPLYLPPGVPATLRTRTSSTTGNLVPPETFHWELSQKLIDQKDQNNNSTNNNNTTPWLLLPPESSDLEMGVLLPKKPPPKPGPGSIVTRCRGCRSHLSVSRWTTLVRCPSCRTVSPASTTRTS